MASNSSLGFAGGFISSLAQGLQAKQQRDEQTKMRQQQSALAAARMLMESGQVDSLADLEPILAVGLPDVFGESAKKVKPKAGEPDHRVAISTMLDQAIRGAKGQAGAGDPNLPGGTAVPGATPTEATAAPPRRTLGGVPLLSPQEVDQRKIERDIANQEQTVTSQVDLARRFYPAMKAVDPTTTMDDVFALLKIKMPRDQASSYQSIAGEVNGKPAFGVFNPRAGVYEDPSTHQPLPGFQPRTTTGSTSLGADRESIARELFGKPAAQLTPEEMAQANTRVESMAASKAGATTTARGESAAKIPLSTAQRFNVLAQLQDDWRKAEAPAKEMQRQLGLMETGLKRFNEGDKIGGSQAVLVTFQKVLDPTSVVRESEYARTSAGLGFLQRIEGAYQRLKEGGAGVPPEELAGMVETAKAFVSGMSAYNDLERERIGSTATDAGLNPDRVFGVAAATPKKPTGKATAPVGATIKDGKLFIDGKLIGTP